MPNQTDNTTTDPIEGDEKPTITIAERQAGSAAETDSKPTITIAEREDNPE